MFQSLSADRENNINWIDIILMSLCNTTICAGCYNSGIKIMAFRLIVKKTFNFDVYFNFSVHSCIIYTSAIGMRVTCGQMHKTQTIYSWIYIDECKKAVWMIIYPLSKWKLHWALKMISFKKGIGLTPLESLVYRQLRICHWLVAVIHFWSFSHRKLKE